MVRFQWAGSMQVGVALAKGTSFVQRSRELIGERVPAFDFLVLVFEAVEPVLQPLTVGVDPQRHAPNEVVGFSNVVVPHRHLQRLLGQICIFNVVTELLVELRVERLLLHGRLVLGLFILVRLQVRFNIRV